MEPVLYVNNADIHVLHVLTAPSALHVQQMLQQIEQIFLQH
jgi:hypothetical protein